MLKDGLLEFSADTAACPDADALRRRVLDLLRNRCTVRDG
jgi:hypothetical protein